LGRYIFPDGYLYERVKHSLWQSVSTLLGYIELYADNYRRTPEKTQKAEDVVEVLTIDRQLATDKIDHIFDEMLSKNDVTRHNLDMLQRCLLKIDNWRNDLDRPQRYERGRTWMSLNQMEMNVMLAFVQEWNKLRDSMDRQQVDLRDALLEEKLLTKEAKMLDLDGLDGLLN